MKPTWCAGVVVKGVAMAPTGDEAWDPIFERGIRYSCVDQDWDVRQKIIAAYRQKVSNALGINAATNERLLKLGSRLLERTARDAQETVLCAKFPRLMSGTSQARATRSLERAALGCSSGVSETPSMSDVDVGAEPKSQLVAAAIVLQVMGRSIEGGDAAFLLEQASTIGVLNAAFAFNPAEFEKQLAALGLNELGQLRAIVTYYKAKVGLERAALALKSIQVTGLQKYAFDGPMAAVRAFRTRAPAEKPLLDIVIALEAQKDEGMKGCAKSLWPRVIAELQGQGQAKLNELRMSGMLAYAMALCSRRDRDVPSLQAIFDHFERRTGGWRGPMAAAYQGILDGYNASVDESTGRAFQPGQADSRNAGLKLKQPGRNPAPEPDLPEGLFGHFNSWKPEERSGGLVQTIENKGATVKFVFKTEVVREPQLSCVETNKIDKIDASGNVRYRENCTIVGWTVTTSTPIPVEVPSWAASGVKVGNYLTCIHCSSTSSCEGRGFIIEAYDSRESKKRRSLFGIAQP